MERKRGGPFVRMPSKWPCVGADAISNAMEGWNKVMERKRGGAGVRL